MVRMRIIIILQMLSFLSVGLIMMSLQVGGHCFYEKGAFYCPTVFSIVRKPVRKPVRPAGTLRTLEVGRDWRKEG